MISFFADSTKVALISVPLGAIGAFSFFLGNSVEQGWGDPIKFLGIAMLIGSGLMWAMHGIAEDNE